MNGNGGWASKHHSSKQPRKGIIYRRVGMTEEWRNHSNLRYLTQLINRFFADDPTVDKLKLLIERLKEWFVGLGEWVTSELFRRLDTSRSFEQQLLRLRAWALQEARARGRAEAARLRAEVDAMPARTFDEERARGLKRNAIEAAQNVAGSELTMAIDGLMALLSTGENSKAVWERVAEALRRLTAKRKRRDQEDDDDFFDAPSAAGPSRPPGMLDAHGRRMHDAMARANEEEEEKEEPTPAPAPASVLPVVPIVPVVPAPAPPRPLGPPRFYYRDTNAVYIDVVESDEEDDDGAANEN